MTHAGVFFPFPFSFFSFSFFSSFFPNEIFCTYARLLDNITDLARYIRSRSTLRLLKAPRRLRRLRRLPFFAGTTTTVPLREIIRWRQTMLQPPPALRPTLQLQMLI